MKRKAFKFALKPSANQVQKLSRFAGHARFVYNKALALEKDTYEKTKKRLGYYELGRRLLSWKKNEETKFLKEAHSQILQQKLADLDKAYDSFFKGRTKFPRFKKKGRNDNFRYPQGFKLDEGNKRVFLPKIGWIKSYKSQCAIGKAKNITISAIANKWYFSVQTEQQIKLEGRTSELIVGIDVGIAQFATLSNGIIYDSLNSYKKYKKKLAHKQKDLARKQKRSSNWNKQAIIISKLHKKIGDMRRDYLHKITTDICKNHATVVLEDIRIKNMSKSGKGTLETPGKNVAAKSGLNRSILDQGWFEFKRQLDYKLSWSGGQLILVASHYTSQKCSTCGVIDRENRKTQNNFLCITCGHKENADLNAAKNIKAAGHAVLACGEILIRDSMKQEPFPELQHAI